MKIKNIELVNLLNGLSYYSDKKLPQKISYAITKNLMTITNEYQTYEKQLNKLFENYDEYTIKDKDGNVIKNDNGIPVVKSEVKEEFESQLADLLGIEIDVSMHFVKEEVFDYDDNGRFDALSAQDIFNLQNMLCEKEKSEKDKESSE